MSSCRGGAVSLVAARGETESAQFLLRTESEAEAGGLHSVRLRLEKAPTGVVCNAFQVGYVNTEFNHRVEGSGGGWRPDPLIALSSDHDPFDVPAGTSQPLWISCTTSAEAPAGISTMRLHLSFLEGSVETSICANIHFQIMPVVMPSLQDSKIGTAWSGAWDKSNFEPYYGSEFNWAASQDKWYEMMLSHRMPPDAIYLQKPRPLEDYIYLADKGVKWFALVDVSNYRDQHGGALLLELSSRPLPRDNANGKSFSLLQLSSNASSSMCSEYYSDAGITRLIETLRPTVEGLEARGLLGRAYVYGFDEKGRECECEIRKVFSATKKAFPKLMTHAVLNWSPMPLDLPVDIWTIAYEKFNPTDAQAWVKAGKVQWHYHCIEPHNSNYLNSFIERPPLQAKLLLWLAALNQLKYGAPSGWLYWAMDYWRPCDSDQCGNIVKRKILERTEVGPMKNTAFTDFPPANYIWKPEIYNIFANGDGQFVYPCAGGPCGSIRLDALQDGLEDWELFQMLGVEDGIPLLESIIRNPTDYNGDAYEIELVRRKALDLLVQKANL